MWPSSRPEDQIAVKAAEEFCQKHQITPGHTFNDPQDGPSVFSGISITGHLICHPVDEPDMQSSWVLKPEAFAKRYLQTPPAPAPTSEHEMRTETLGQMGRRIVDEHRREVERRSLEQQNQKRLQKIEHAKKLLPNEIAQAARDGRRYVTAIDLEEDGIVTKDDIPLNLSCALYQGFWDYLTSQGLIPKLECSKAGYGAYNYFLTASW